MKSQVSAALLAAATLAQDYCPDMHDVVDFDTPAYQAQSAYCKQQMIWRMVKMDDTPQQFFVGEEFADFFK